jgi:hypothetical protein
MKWILKAFLQRTIGVLPAHERINYFFQKKITKNLPVTDVTFDEKIELAAQRVDLFRRFSNGITVQKARFLEFGAGWDLIGPLAMSMLGVQNQILLDITSHLRFELIMNALDRLRKHSIRFKEITGQEPLLFSGIVENKNDLLRLFGIDYRAPLDAASTGFKSGSIDFISTNSTLEHIPASELRAIMQESFRILAPGGLMCHFIDLKDHYSYFDTSISKYHFLKFSKFWWSFYNSSLHYQNRLRLPEYQALIAEAGFEILYEEIDSASEKELSDLRLLNIHPDFKDRFSIIELSAQLYRVVARKPLSSNVAS